VSLPLQYPGDDLTVMGTTHENGCFAAPIEMADYHNPGVPEGKNIPACFYDMTNWLEVDNMNPHGATDSVDKESTEPADHPPL
jgi:hypothetical protein